MPGVFQILRPVGVVNFFTSLQCSTYRGDACVASTFFLKISAMDLSAQKTMKSAANCDKQCELQIFEKHQNLERALRFRVTLVSNSASVSSHSTAAIGLLRLVFGVASEDLGSHLSMAIISILAWMRLCFCMIPRRSVHI